MSIFIDDDYKVIDNKGCVLGNALECSDYELLKSPPTSVCKAITEFECNPYSVVTQAKMYEIQKEWFAENIGKVRSEQGWIYNANVLSKCIPVLYNPAKDVYIGTVKRSPLFDAFNRCKKKIIGVVGDFFKNWCSEIAHTAFDMITEAGFISVICACGFEAATAAIFVKYFNNVKILYDTVKNCNSENFLEAVATAFFETAEAKAIVFTAMHTEQDEPHRRNHVDGYKVVNCDGELSIEVSHEYGYTRVISL